MARDLDARVAELMGWTRPLNNLPKVEGWEHKPFAPLWMQHTNHPMVTVDELQADKYWSAPDGSYHEHPPNYSGDWAAFGELYERLDAEGDEIEIHNRYVDDWTSTVKVNGQRADGEPREALCEAALKAKEGEG